MARRSEERRKRREGTRVIESLDKEETPPPVKGKAGKRKNRLFLEKFPFFFFFVQVDGFEDGCAQRRVEVHDYAWVPVSFGYDRVFVLTRGWFT